MNDERDATGRVRQTQSRPSCRSTCGTASGANTTSWSRNAHSVQPQSRVQQGGTDRAGLQGTQAHGFISLQHSSWCFVSKSPQPISSLKTMPVGGQQTALTGSSRCSTCPGTWAGGRRTSGRTGGHHHPTRSHHRRRDRRYQRPTCRGCGAGRVQGRRQHGGGMSGRVGLIPNSSSRAPALTV